MWCRTALLALLVVSTETQPAREKQPCDAFQCYNNKCLSLDDVCNIKKDCHEGEDESELQGCGKTPPGTPCDFESGQCGWKRGQGELEWKYRSGHESAERVAPAFDNTLGNASGHFMLLEFISGDFSAYGELVSPAFPPMPAYNSDPHSPYYMSCKFRFFIHMYGTNMGAASVSIIDMHNRKEEIWRLFGSQKSNDWVPQVVALPTSFNDSYYLMFSVAKSFSNKVSIGIDDLSLSRECFAEGGAPQLQEDEPYADPEELAIYDAQMVSTSESLTVREGANISLPCQWESEHGHADDVIVLWKKRPTMILFTGTFKYTADERLRLGPNNQLQLFGVTAADSGTYVCTVAVKPDAIELEHTVNVEWPAKLHPLDQEHYKIQEGEKFELTCGAEGNPEPVITWSKLPATGLEGPYVDNGDLVATTDNPEGDDMAYLPENPSRSVALTLDPVKPHNTGTYTCTAQNGVGQPDMLTARLEVMHAPYITQDSGVVRTAHGLTAKIGCKVFANPRAEVIWQRNGHDLPINSRYETAVSSTYFALTIRDVQDEDFANYTCRAKNSLGQNEYRITLTGLPGSVALHLGKPTPAENGRGQHSVTVTWEFTSFATVEETEVTLEPVPDGHEEIKRVPTVTSTSVSKTGKQQLSPLNENTTYMVRVKARNQYGWTPPAEVYFSVNSGELTITQAPLKPAVPAESKTKNGAETTEASWKLTPILLIAILSSFFC